MPKVILYIATSLDGFIADKDGGVGWLPHPTDDPEDEFGYKALMNRISAIVMGSKSYEQILGFGDWAWGDKTTYVFTKRTTLPAKEGIQFIHEDPKIFMESIKEQQSDIWLLGGAKLAKSFALAGLIDECVITIIPMKLGDGIKLELPYGYFNLIETKLCRDDMLQQTYIKNLM